MLLALLRQLLVEPWGDPEVVIPALAANVAAMVVAATVPRLRYVSNLNRRP